MNWRQQYEQDKSNLLEQLEGSGHDEEAAKDYFAFTDDMVNGRMDSDMVFEKERLLTEKHHQSGDPVTQSVMNEIGRICSAAIKGYKGANP